MNKKYVYLFNEGNANMRELLGRKGGKLAEMTNTGFPVPPGFIITTEACNSYFEKNKNLTDDIKNEVFDYLYKLERITGKKFGDCENPLIVSVRVGARGLVPGEMPTVLNIGLNDKITDFLVSNQHNEYCVLDSYRRLIQMYGISVNEISSESFDDIVENFKKNKMIEENAEFTIDDLKELIQLFKETYRKITGMNFPQDVKEQLFEAIKAGFNSWDNPRANNFREHIKIPFTFGTAVTIQSMVFGNKGAYSGTGFVYSRDPVNGTKGLVGKFLTNAQGDDVNARNKTPMSILEFEKRFPDIYEQLSQICEKIDNHFRDMQAIEFTIEEGKIFILGSYSGARDAQASIKIACDLVDEGLKTEEEAVNSIFPGHLKELLSPVFDENVLSKMEPIEKGTIVKTGIATGKIVLSSSSAEELSATGEKGIIILNEFTMNDIKAGRFFAGMISVREGNRSFGKMIANIKQICFVTDCKNITIDEANKTVVINGKQFREGDVISVDGFSGNIYEGAVPTSAPRSNELNRVLEWARKYNIGIGNNETEKYGTGNSSDNRDIENSYTRNNDISSKTDKIVGEDIDPIKKESSFFEKLKKLFK